jgi:hypothetical protein
VREVALGARTAATEAGSFRACLAAILELAPDAVPDYPSAGGELPGWHLTRWLGGLGLGLVPVEDAASFSWAGPWIGWVRPAGGDGRRAVVMYGVPSGVAWDPSEATGAEGWQLEGGLVVAALDVALARPRRPEPPASAGTVEGIFIAPRPAHRCGRSTRLGRSPAAGSTATATSTAPGRSRRVSRAAP